MSYSLQYLKDKGFNIKYGIGECNIDITQVALEKCVTDNILTIPSCDITRANMFTDPLQGSIKNISIKKGQDDDYIVYESNEIIKINLEALYPETRGFTIKYGTEEYNIDITQVALEKCVKNNVLTIPPCDITRSNMFTDPVYGVSKSIFMNNKKYSCDDEIIMSIDSEKSFDVTILVGPNDNEVVDSVISFTKQNVIGYRNIYLICANPNISIDGTITIDEKIFPFKMQDLDDKFGQNSRSGWYLQQLLKMYAGNIVPGILPRYLIIDCDTHFIKPAEFITNDGRYIYTTGTEYHHVYFDHMSRLHPSLKKIHPLSGISHHTFFDKNILNEMFELIEKYHNNKPFWHIYLDEIDRTQYNGSGAAENELFFTYMYLYHQDKMFIREGKWYDVSKIDLNEIARLANDGYNFISCHWWCR